MHLENAAAAIAYFDSLPAVRTHELRGRYRGAELRTGHPMEGKLAAAGWYGKQFDGEDEVHPLLFESRGHVFAIDPRRLPFAMAGQKLPSWMAAAGRGVLRAFATHKHRARLRDIEHRGVVTAAMIYDALPIIDIFRRVDERTVLGWMDVRRQKQPYFFHLVRDARSEHR